MITRKLYDYQQNNIELKPEDDFDDVVDGYQNLPNGDYTSITAYFGPYPTSPYNGGVLGKDGKVYMIPNTSGGNIGIFDPEIDTLTTGAAIPGSTTGGGGVLLDDGRIVMGSTYIYIYDPETNIFTKGPYTGKIFIGLVRAFNGKIILIPYTSSCVGIYDPETNIYTNGPAHGKTYHASYGGYFWTGCLSPNGKIIFCPETQPVIGIYDPETNIYTDGPVTSITIGSNDLGFVGYLS